MEEEILMCMQLKGMREIDEEALDAFVISTLEKEEGRHHEREGAAVFT